jgi:molybdate transport system substrate-binding protein
MFPAISAAAPLLWAAYAPNEASGAEIALLSPGAVGSSLHELVPQFEQTSGHKVKVGYSPALALVDKLKQGEIADVAIVGSSAADELMKLGKFAQGSRTPVSSSWARCPRRFSSTRCMRPM